MNDQIRYWNEALLEANIRDHTGVPVAKAIPTRGPTGTSRAFAIVHLAMRDAVVAVRGTKPTYTKVSYTGPSTDAARDAAISAAAQCTLAALWPEQEDFFTAHAEASPTPAGVGIDDGHRLGVQVANVLLTLRRNDGAATQIHYAASSARGRHRVDPLNPGQEFLGATWGDVAHFVARPPNQHFPLRKPPGYDTDDFLSDPNYRLDHDEVRSVGELVSSARLPEQEQIGTFWAYDGVAGIGTPPRLYNQILRTVADLRETTVDENAELFALANVAMADACIEAWFWKYHYNLWRPVIGIREASPSNGPSGEPGINSIPDADPFWIPLGSPPSNQPGQPRFTPPFPSYPSGHATFGAALFQTIQAFLGGPEITTADVLSDRPAKGYELNFNVVSDELNGVTTGPEGVRTRHVRHFADLVEPVRENALSRVYLGVHWRFDGVPRDSAENVGGVPLGLAVARDVVRRGLIRP